MKNFSAWSRSHLELPFFAWTRSWSQPNLVYPEPESASGHRTSGAGAVQRSGGSATLVKIDLLSLNNFISFIPNCRKAQQVLLVIQKYVPTVYNEK